MRLITALVAVAIVGALRLGEHAPRSVHVKHLFHVGDVVQAHGLEGRLEELNGMKGA